MLTTPYDLAERTRRVLIGVYNELRQAATDGAAVDFIASLEFLDALKDTLQGPDAPGLVEWFVAPNGNIVWDTYGDEEETGDYKDDELPTEQPYLERVKLLAKNKRIARLLRKVNTIESLSLLAALRDCAAAKKVAGWPWEVTPSGTVIRSDFGAPRAKENQLEAEGAKLWGRSIEIRIKVLYMPELEQQIIAGAPRSEHYEPDDIRQAIVAHVDAALSRPALERAGLLAVETAARNSEPTEIPEELQQLILSQGKSETLQ